MGLAAAAGLNQWRVLQDFETARERCSAWEIGKKSWPLTACLSRTRDYHW
jgi:hypothetical protein